MSSQLSMFEKVQKFNKTFSSPTYNTYTNDIWNDTKLIKLRQDLINEEVQELNEAIENKDITETMDALADILVVTLGAFDALGINGDKVFDEVHSSNMSKLCNTIQEAQDSVEWYKKNKLDIYPEPDYRKADSGEGYVIYNKSSGKVLKNINWKEPDLKDTTKYTK